jgi:4-amino-4-deoxy-L-arabinose transferase-like glycosyltransferase
VAPLLAPALYVLVAWPALRENSATYDETAYVPAGFTYLARGDFRLSPEHPPLLKLLYALPLLPLRPRISPDAERAFEAAASQIDAQWIFGDRFLYRDNPPEPLLFRARLVSLALGALLAFLVHAWAREVVGTAGALFASLLFALDPGFLAHGTLATTDVGATLFFFAALYFARRALRALAIPDALAAALCGGAAFASKFSAVLLVPTIGVLALLRVLRRDPWPVGRGGRVLRGLGARARWAILLLFFWGASCFGCLWACYGFRYRAFAGEGPPLAIAEQTSLIRRVRLYGEVLDGRTSFPDLASFERAVESTPPPLSERVIDLCARGRLLPEAYLYGLAFAAQKAQARSSYLLGNYTVRGSPAYFPVAFAVKTPLATLAALAAALLLLATKGGRARLAGEKAFLLVPAAVVAFAAVGSNLNIGHRHLLPVYPFLFVLAGCVPGEVARLAGRRLAALATSILLAGLALETGSARPWFLPFFNRLAGGAEGGVRILSDSNLDWGQALPALRRWMRERGVAKVNLCYFGTADPRAYGISFNPIPGNYQLEVPGAGTAGEEARPAELPGWIAIGATNLQGVYFPEPLRRHYSYLLRKRPVAILGGAIYVYWVVRPGE